MPELALRLVDPVRAVVQGVSLVGGAHPALAITPKLFIYRMAHLADWTPRLSMGA